MFPRLANVTSWTFFLLAPALLLALLLTLFAAPASAATLTVCPQGGQYGTIQAAVNAANAGDVLQICAGDYAESVDLSLMGSNGGSLGDITLAGMGQVTVAPASGSAVYLTENFSGSIILENIHTTSPDANAVDFSYDIYGSLTISGGGAANAAGMGLVAYVVRGGITIEGAAFLNNSGTGVYVLAERAGDGCASVAAGAQGAGVTAIEVTGARAIGNGGSGFGLDSGFGDIYINDAEASANSDDGFAVSIYDACAGSTVFIDGSRADGNGNPDYGSGVNLYAYNAHIANTAAMGNAFDGVRQQLGEMLLEQAAATDVWSMEVVRTTAAANGRHGFNLGSVDFVTITSASAISNAAAGILIPFLPDAEFAQRVAITGALVISNPVGIELAGPAWSAAGGPAAAAEVAAAEVAASGNIVCANTSAGVIGTGETTATYAAVANYWGSFTGPQHPAQNPGGTGDRVIDGANGGAGNVLIAPWVDEGVVAATPAVGLAGQQQVISVTFPAGAGPGLRRGPGDPNNGPLFTVTTSNGVLATAYGVGASAPAALDASGQITALLTPSAAGAATVTITGPCGLTATRSVPVAAPSVTISKNPPLQAVVNGGSAAFQVAITNTGDISLTDITVSDPAAPDCAQSFATLSPGASATYACAQTGVATSYTNQITVTATPLTNLPAPAPVTATASAQVAVVNPGLSAVKSVGLNPDACAPAGPLTAPISSSLYYCITLLNTGDVTLTEHLISDPLLGITGAPISAPLAPGAGLAITRSLLPGLGPIVMTGAITNVVSITSTGEISQVGGVGVPVVGVRALSAGEVSVNTQPTDLEPEPEPVDTTHWLYLPALRR